MSSNPSEQNPDRRAEWKPAPRPEWLATFNALGSAMDIRGVVPLDMDSLLFDARHNTGLDDFGDDGWRERFQVLLDAVDTEADLNFFGRILTRQDFLTYLQARLHIIDLYKRHPEIDDEVVHEPVFILGLGRSGTTILHEVLSQDPQFRSVRRWEALFPAPPPEEATYHNDPRIQKAQALIDVIHTVAPAWKSMHAQGGDLPVEDIEFTYSALFSEVWINAFQIPSYEKWFAAQDPTPHFEWHKKIIKLLQWKFKRSHWLFKNPTHMGRLQYLLKTYPDAKIILPHRDPVATADSVVNVSSSIYHWRSDKLPTPGVGDEWMQADSRAKLWDQAIDMIESGELKKGSVASILYADFISNPGPALQAVYRDLNLPLDPAALDKSVAYMEERSKGSHGNSSKYKKSTADDPRVLEERRKYARYQNYFNVPNEI
jgi:hypothetical protein